MPTPHSAASQPGICDADRDAPAPESVTQDHWVYVCRDNDSEVLYVGYTGQGLGRFRHGHSRTAPWWRDVATVEIAHFDRQPEALAHERHQIAVLRPAHNVAYTFPSAEVDAAVPDQDTVPTNWLNIGQIAGWMGVDVQTVVDWMEAGVPHMLLSDLPRFKAADVRAWRTHHKEASQ